MWSGPVRARTSRRRFLGVAAGGVAGAAGVALIGCGGGGDESKGAATSTAGQAEAAQKGGVAKLMLPDEPPLFDPHVNPVTPNLIWGGFIGDSLMNFNPDTLALEPRIATKWEFPDPTTIVLQVRDGVRFHDKPPANGRAVTAQDVAYTLERARTNDPSFLYRTRYDRVDTIEAPDARTVRIRLKGPSASTLTYISANPVLNREAIEASAGVIKDPRTAVGTGPFMVGEHQAGVGGKLVRNPNYWESGKPYLDGVQWAIIKDAAAIIAAYRAGDLDFGGSLAGTVDGNGKKQLERGNLNLSFVPLGVSWPVMFLTHNQKPPFNDIRVRKAVDLAADRPRLVDVVRGGAAAPAGPIWEGLLPGYGFPDKELLARPGYRQPKDQDLADAKKLLEAAGYGGGLDLPSDGTEYLAWINLDALTASVEQLAKVGIKVHIDKLLDRATFLDTEARDVALFRALGVGATSVVESQDHLRVRYHSSSPRNYQRYKVAEVDQQIDKQDTVLDTKERQALTVQIQRRIMDDVALPHLFWAFDYAVIQPWIRGIKPTIVQGYGRPGDWWRTKA